MSVHVKSRVFAFARWHHWHTILRENKLYFDYLINRRLGISVDSNTSNGNYFATSGPLLRDFGAVGPVVATRTNLWSALDEEGTVIRQAD